MSRAGGWSRLRGVGELFPPPEEQAEEAYGYGYAVGPDAEEDLPLGDALEGKGFFVHGCCSCPGCRELRFGADRSAGIGARPG